MGGTQSQAEESAGSPSAAPAEGGPPPAPAAPAPAPEAGTSAAGAQPDNEKREGAQSDNKKKDVREGSQIWVGNLTEKTSTEEEIRRHFGGFGQITDVRLKTSKKRPGANQTYYAFVTFTTLESAKAAVEALAGKVICEGEDAVLVSFADRQGDGKGKGKGKETKGGGKASKGKGGKGKNAAAPPAFGQPYPYYNQYYSQEQLQSAWALAHYYSQMEASALQAQAYYSGFTGQVIPSQAAISAAAHGGPSAAKPPPAANPPAPPTTEFTGIMKSISAKNGYGFIICDETKNLYGRDVFVEQKILPEEIEVKCKVAFTVELSEKGHPRASSVRKIAGAEA